MEINNINIIKFLNEIINPVKNVLLTTLGFFQFLYEKVINIHREIIYKQEEHLNMKKNIKKLSKREVLEDLLERGKFSIDYTKLILHDFKGRMFRRTA